MEFSVILLLIFIRFATGLDFLEHGNFNDSQCATFTLSVDIDTRAKLVDMIFKRNVEYIEVSVYIENELLDTFLQNSNITVNPTVAMPPYHKFIWVNQAGMNIHQMDYRFKMWSLGTLSPSVKAINLNLETNNTDCLRNINVTDLFEKIQNTFRKALYYSGSNNAIDYFYLCHRYERYTDHEVCLASKCFMFNEKHQSHKDGFCSNNVNKLVNAQNGICIFLFIFLINNLPLLVFWLKENLKATGTDKKEDPGTAQIIHNNKDPESGHRNEGRRTDEIELSEMKNNEANRAEVAGQANGAEQAGQANGAEQAGQANGAEQAGQANGAEQAGQANRAEQAGQANRAEQAGQANGAEQAGQAYGAEQAGQANGAEQAGQANGAEQAGQANGAEQAGQANRAEQAGQANRAEQAGQANRAEQAGQANGAEQAGQANGAEQAGQANGAEQAGQANGAEQAGQACDTQQVILCLLFLLCQACRFVFIFVFTLVYILWFLIADFTHKPIEFRQRSEMSKGTDDYLLCFELLLAHIWNVGSIIFLVCLVCATLGNAVLVIVMGWTSGWERKKQFWLLQIECKDPNLQFNCLHRQSLLLNWSFWKAFWKSLLPKCWYIPYCPCYVTFCCEFCVIVVVVVLKFLATLMAIVFLMCPLLDIVLHMLSGHDDNEKTTCATIETDSKTFIFKKRKIKCTVFTLGLIIYVPPALFYYGACFFAYIYPTAVVCSMIVSYTITGIMKNWDSLLPILLFLGILINHLVKFVNVVREPGHDLHIMMYQTYQKISPEFKEIREKFEQLNSLKQRGHIRFQDVVELLIGFPKLNPFIEQKYGNYYIGFPKLYEWMELFPCLKRFITFKDGSFFLCVPECLKLVPDISKEFILEKDDHYYIKCQKIQNLNENTSACLQQKGLILEQDESYFIKTIISNEVNLNWESNNHAYGKRGNLYFAYQTVPEKGGLIHEQMEKYYIKADPDFMELDNTEKVDIKRSEILLLTENSYYIQCPQKLFEYLNQVDMSDLIERKNNGDYYSVPDPSLEDKCCRFLKHGRLSFYTFDAFVELVGVCLFVAVIWIGIFMLDDDDRNIGKVLVAVFLTHIPKSFGIFTTPWSEDASKSKKYDYINEIMKEELKKRQNALTLVYISLTLLFYCNDINIPSVVEEDNNQWY